MAKTQKEHYSEFLSRISTLEDFRKEIRGKLEAVRQSGFPIDLVPEQIDFLISILPLNTLGKPQFWPIEEHRGHIHVDLTKRKK